MCDKGAIHSMRFDVLYIGRRNKFFYLIPKLATRCPNSSKIICICPTLCIDGAIRARKNIDSADLPIQFYFYMPGEADGISSRQYSTSSSPFLYPTFSPLGFLSSYLTYFWT